MQTESKMNGEVNWAQKRWSQYEIKLKDPKNAAAFDRDITGNVSTLR